MSYPPISKKKSSTSLESFNYIILEWTSPMQVYYKKITAT